MFRNLWRHIGVQRAGEQISKYNVDVSNFLNFRAVRDAILSSRYRNRIDGFVTLHTYSQIWIHPYGHRKDSYPGDVQDLVSWYLKHLLAFYSTMLENVRQAH